MDCIERTFSSAMAWKGRRAMIAVVIIGMEYIVLVGLQFGRASESPSKGRSNGLWMEIIFGERILFHVLFHKDVY